MRYIQEIEGPETIRILVLQDLKELGIKVPKVKKNKGKEESLNANNHSVYGNYISLVPCLMIEECGPVPKFLVQATHILDKHIDIEGLFRKSGSVARQKELKSKIESGDDLYEANPLDVAGLIKQFFRELPDPLFTTRLHDTFLKCYSMESEDARVTAILLLCHQLPWHHLSTLRYVMLFLQKVAHNCDLNKMDIANLAVCVTPNLMHINNVYGKSEKMNMTESKLLQCQTNIVQILMLCAGDIGMVPDSLYERAMLMNTCFPTDDELERSEAVAPEDHGKSVKKKKRRSGSLQGLVSNLSSSFTKWRKDGKAHNASSMSDKSTMSYLSFEKSSMMSLDHTDISRHTLPPPGGYMQEDFIDPLCPEATPKVIRKRKAVDEVVPFSASKKKAILQHMPQMSTLGNTPFTPTARRAHRYQADFQETPNIKFADADNAIFNASATPIQTPKRKMDKLFSPYSATKVKRNSSGKAGCFSPKTSKSNMRKSVRGFFRRLSGGKEQPSPSSSSSLTSEVSQRLGGIPDSLHIMDPCAGQKKSTFFRRHKKTPSSPARLVTNMTAELQREKAAMASRGSSASSVRRHDSDMENGQYDYPPDCDYNMLSPNSDLNKTPVVIGGKINRSNLSLDSTATSLRRGKPNTVKTGLPQEYNKRRSFDVNFDRPEDDKDSGDMMINTIDTSPILKEAGRRVCCSPREIDVDAPESDRDVFCRQSSKTSLMEESLSGALESGFDQAFINESMMVDSTQVDVPTGERDPPQGEDAEDDCPTPVSCADFSVKYRLLELSSEPAPGNKHNAGKLVLATQNSVVSLDSAVGTDTMVTDSASKRTQPISKSTSLHSLQSCDSGLGDSKETLCSDSSKVKCNGHLAVRSDSILERHNSTYSSTRSVSIRPTPNKYKANKHRNAEPNLQISSDMHSMLTKAGVVSNEEESTDTTTSPPSGRESVLDLQGAARVTSGVQQFNDSKEAMEISKRHESPLRFVNSTSRRPHIASPIRIPTIFAKADKEASHYRELAKAAVGSASKPSAARKINLPISTSLLGARDMVKLIDVDPGTPEYAEVFGDDTAGHTPARALQQGSMKVICFDNEADVSKTSSKQPLKDNNYSVNTSLLTEQSATTPQIKQSLLTSGVGARMMGKSAAAAAKVAADTVKKYRTPIKPVKRLQASPHSPHNRRSPKRFSPSPRKGVNTSRAHQMSPLPNLDSGWNI